MDLVVKPPIRILFWATTFGADMHSFARYLESKGEYKILVAAHSPEMYLREPVQNFYPVNAPILDRDKKSTWLRILLFRPHIMVTDNHFPPVKFAKRLLVLWHGFGWRKDNLSGEFVHVHNNIRRLVGDAAEPNPHFAWQCWGPQDKKYRHEVSGFALENLEDLGFAQADDLRKAPDKDELQQIARHYTIDILNKRTILLAFTWHHGKVLSHWGDDMELFDELFSFADDLGVNLLVRMHDRFRFDAKYHRELDELMKGRDNVMIKFKDEYPDNLLDMLVSDVMVSNYSSILNRFYITGKPTIHVYPDSPNPDTRNADDSGDRITSDGNGISCEQKEKNDQKVWRKLGDDGSLVEEIITDLPDTWKFPAEWNGGIMVYTLEELKVSLKNAIEEPDCCLKRSREFIADGITGADGHTCERTERALLRLLSN